MSAVMDRTLDKFVVTEECWPWERAIAKGYGRVKRSDGRGSAQAHEVVYEALVGPVPVGKQLDHLCRNRACVRPSHLDPVTRRVNILRGTGFSAVNARKERCVNGHPFNATNTWLRLIRDGSTKRECRPCRRAAFKRWKARHLRKREEER